MIERSRYFATRATIEATEEAARFNSSASRLELPCLLTNPMAVTFDVGVTVRHNHVAQTTGAV